ncbi:MAG: hypothetical protein MJ234_05230 [bacterium]|nr:hypothetical protein [bacterium]
MSQNQDYLIVTNSPGELSAWVRPVASELKRREPSSRVIVLLVPCFYATGREQKIAEAFDCVDLVLTPADFMKIAFGGMPKSFKPSPRIIVISLGGDPWHSVLMSRKLNCKAVIYTMKKADTGKSFAHIFSIHEKLKERFIELGVDGGNITVVGDLMQDGVKPSMTPSETRKRFSIKPSSKVVSFFPGSRLSHVQESIPVFLKACEEIRENIPDSEFVICLSPFVNFDDLKKFSEKRASYNIDGTWGRIDGDFLETGGGVRIRIERDIRFDVISMSDLVITIPGTNTAEIASLGKPMIVAYSWKAKIPSGGLGFLINAIPFTGHLRKAVMTFMYRKIKFKGLPNALAEKEITPELLVEDSSEELSSLACSLLNDPERLSEISRELLGIMGGGGAAGSIAAKTIQIAKED